MARTTSHTLARCLGMLLICIAIVCNANAQVVARTPQMGWNSWNTFKGDINQSVIQSTADLLVSTGLREAGYTYLVIDDGWQNSSRSLDGRQQANTTRFPDGMAAVGEYLHQLGLKFGIYSTAGIRGCVPNSPGSWGFEELDAETYANWGVDYLKYDNCGTFEAGTVSPAQRFSLMRDALASTGREIFYSLCEWGHQFPWFWADQVGHSYRMSGDITTTFSDTGKDCACQTAYCLNTGYAGCSVLTIIRKMREISQFQHPGSFADMDMLEIGVANMTLQEQRTHFSFWAALKSPLIIGADLRKISKESLSVLKKKEVLAISQDPLGSAAHYVPALSQEKNSQVWAGELSRGRTVVLAFNELNKTAKLSVPLGRIPGLSIGRSHSIHDVWSDKTFVTRSVNLTLEADAHETKLMIVS